MAGIPIFGIPVCAVASFSLGETEVSVESPVLFSVSVSRISESDASSGRYCNYIQSYRHLAMIYWYN